MILGWSFYAIGRLGPQIASCQSFPSSPSSLPFWWMDLRLSMILHREDAPITATGNSFAQSDGFNWVHIRREHFLTSMILFRMASKPITWLFNSCLKFSPWSCCVSSINRVVLFPLIVARSLFYRVGNKQGLFLKIISTNFIALIPRIIRFKSISQI